MSKRPGGEAFRISFKFSRHGLGQRLADFNRFSSIETRSCYSCLVLYLHGPAISPFVTNCYATPTRLFVIGSTKIRSNEGSTQGDLAAMTTYALGIAPPIMMMMIKLVTTKYDDIKMAAFADDFIQQEN